jgi:hypothetical protein
VAIQSHLHVAGLDGSGLEAMKLFVNTELFVTVLGLPFRRQYQWRVGAFGGNRSKESEIGFCLPIRILMYRFLSHIRDGLILGHDQ